MTTLPVAINALIKVGHDWFVANAGDPTYGTLYANMDWDRWPFNGYTATYRPSLYEYQAAPSQGWAVERWLSHPARRLFANVPPTRQMFALRAAWIATSTIWSAPPGGLLRHTGA
jgi:hypothetical protein